MICIRYYKRGQKMGGLSVKYRVCSIGRGKLKALLLQKTRICADGLY